MKNQEQKWLLKEKYHGVESSAFHSDCARLDSGVPLGYLIGHIPFLNCTIDLTSHPLIPRPETEYWTEKAIAEIKRWQSTVAEGTAPKILDLCAGSGAIGIAIACATPEACVTFAEIEGTHLPTIKKNLLANLSIDRKVSEDNYAVLETDLFLGVKGVFDFIVTNPPYIDKVAGTVAPSVAQHEPHIALFGGVAGMEIIERIIKDARPYLTPATHLATGGQLWIEHEPFQVAAIAKCATQHLFHCTAYPDQYNTDR